MKKIWHNIVSALSENFAAEQSRWLMVVPFLFALGIAVYFALPTEPSVWLTLGIFELWLLLFYLCRFKNMHLFFIAGLIVMSGFINIQVRTLYQSKRVENIDDRQITYLKGKIIDISRSATGKQRLLLTDVEDFDKPLKGNFRLTATVPQNLEIDDCIETVGTLFPPRPIPVPNGFKLDRKYFYESLSATGYTNSEIFKIKCPTPTQSFMSAVNRFRQNFADYTDSVLAVNEAGIADAIIIGEKSRILQNITDNYRDSGLAHFLSVSGLHLGTIAGLAFFVIRFLLALFPIVTLRFNIKKIAAGFAILFSTLYLLISGMATPAERAFIMTTVVFIGIIFDREAISMRMVSFAALVVLVIAPQALISVSFQMSFAAVYALIAFYEVYATKLSAGLYGKNFIVKIFYYLLGIVVCDFVASIATAPISLYHFQRIAVYTSLGNLLAGPLIGLWLMPAILLCLATIPFGIAFYPLKFLGIGLELLNKITDWVAHLPHSVWHCDNLPFYGFILIVCGGFWLCIWQRPWRRLGIILITAGILPMFVPTPQPDIIVAPQAESIAFKNGGHYEMLQFKNNNFLTQIWQEKYKLQKHKIRTFENIKKLAIPQISCAEKYCTVNDFEFDLSGEVRFKGEKLDTGNGFGIYQDGLIKPFAPNKKRRLWEMR
ncbi:MAG: ComEC/Rec2 family competence protein [Alphaproteobacteria bacterium]|nr:ComEC/Rec2 family competence protein [Alphaproteobacteria bacterium]